MTIHKGYITNIALLAEGTKNPGGNYIYKSINVRGKLKMTTLSKIKFYYYLIVAWVRFKRNERPK